MKATVDIAISAITLICALYIIVSMGWFICILRKRFINSPLTWVFLSIVIAKLAIADWAQTNLVRMIFNNQFPPMSTLRPRLLIMAAVVIQIVAIVIMWSRRYGRIRIWPKL